MEHISRPIGYEKSFVNTIQTINNNQKRRFVEKIEHKLDRPLEGRENRRLGPGVQSRH